VVKDPPKLLPVLFRSRYAVFIILHNPFINHLKSKYVVAGLKYLQHRDNQGVKGNYFMNILLAKSDSHIEILLSRQINSSGISRGSGLLPPRYYYHRKQRNYQFLPLQMNSLEHFMVLMSSLASMRVGAVFFFLTCAYTNDSTGADTGTWGLPVGRVRCL